MFKSLALFALLNAAFVSSSSVIRAPAAAAVASAGPVTNSANAILVFTTCNNINQDNCLTWTATTLPVGCTNLDANGQTNVVSSVATAPGVGCILFTTTTCSGKSQFINGTLNDLDVVGFNDIANSFTCAST